MSQLDTTLFWREIARLGNPRFAWQEIARPSFEREVSFFMLVTACHSKMRLKNLFQLCQQTIIE